MTIVLVLAAIAGPASAATYKWTDANGRVVYSDQPPNGNFKVESLDAPPPPANPNAAKELAAKEAEIKQRRLLRAEDESKAATTRAEASLRKDQCEKASGQMAMLQSGQNQVYRANAKGEPVFVDDTARRREMQELDAWMKQNCKS